MTKLYDAKPFIVAEIGSNWRDLSDCVESVGRAKAAGADAVKFQAFTWEGMYAEEPTDHPFTFPEIYERQLRLAWLPALKEKADACDIELMCTAFSPELVKAVDPFVSVHKIASSDLNYPDLLKAVGDTGKPVLLSCGASHVLEIKSALDILPRTPVLMYCVAAYPAREINLDVIDLLRDEVCGLVGFSDHSTDVIGLPYLASQKRIVALEKHVTAFPDLQTPDRPHSLTMDEFKTMVDWIRGRRTTSIGPMPEEKAMLLRHKRRLIATKDINLGDLMVYGENFGAYRSLKDDHVGMSPFGADQLKKKHAVIAIKRGDGIGPRDFK